MIPFKARLKSGDDLFVIEIVACAPHAPGDKPRWYSLYVMRSVYSYEVGSGGEGHYYYVRTGELLRATLRRNGRYVLVGADRDRGPYVAEASLEPGTH